MARMTRLDLSYERFLSRETRILTLSPSFSSDINSNQKSHSSRLSSRLPLVAHCFRSYSIQTVRNEQKNHELELPFAIFVCHGRYYQIFHSAGLVAFARRHCVFSGTVSIFERDFIGTLLRPSATATATSAAAAPYNKPPPRRLQ